MHEPEGKAAQQTVAGEIEDIAMKLLDIAGKMYSKGADEVIKAKDKTRKKISDTQCCHSLVYRSTLWLMDRTIPHSHILLS